MTAESTGGSCACGAVSFALSKKPEKVGMCHCGICRRNGGGGAWNGLQALPDDIKGDITWWRSSGWGERGSCAKCGSSMFWRLRSGKGDWVVGAGTLADDSGLSVDMHIYVDDKPDYYDIAEGNERLTGKEFTDRVVSGMKLPMRMVVRTMLVLQALRPAGKQQGSKPSSLKRGQCCCGNVQLSLGSEPAEFVLCHCATCRKANGGMAGLWAEAGEVGFGSGDTLRWWTSSENCERGFCSRCGSSLAKRYANGTIQVAVGALDPHADLSMFKAINVGEAPRYFTVTTKTAP